MNIIIIEQLAVAVEALASFNKPSPRSTTTTVIVASSSFNFNFNLFRYSVATLA